MGRCQSLWITNRENNEGYYFRVPKHTNNLFVQENSKRMHFFGLNSFAKTDLERKLPTWNCADVKEMQIIFPVMTQAFRLP